MRLGLVPGVVLVALLSAVAPGCSGGDDVADAPGDCPMAPLEVVVSVAPWTDLVATLAGDCADITTVVRGDVDPHEFEPTPADSAAFEQADLIVLNGLDYDHWAEAAVEVDGAATVLDAGTVAGRSEGDDPHLWYDPDVVTKMTTAVGEELANQLPAAAAYLDEQRTRWDDALDGYRTAIDRLADDSGTDRTYVATEPVFDPMAARLGLVDETPAGFRRAAANETDPSPRDIAELEAAVRDGVDVMVLNTQTADPTSDRLRELADTEGVPIVEMTETPPAGMSFVDWQTAQLESLAEALGR